MDSVQSFLAVLSVLGLLCGALWFLRNRGVAAFRLPHAMGAGNKRMEVLERVSLGPQQALHLVRVGGRSVVVATGPGTCQMVMEVNE